MAIAERTAGTVSIPDLKVRPGWAGVAQYDRS
jgi:hypothetical protein